MVDRTEVFHDNFVILDSQVLKKTSQDSGDPRVGNTQKRIGDKTNFKGVSNQMMVELPTK